MKIINKASWHIDGGFPESLVIKHFKTVFTWLDCKDMLSPDGKEELQFGIDESVSLHEGLLSCQALVFLEKRYDDYLKSVDFGNDEDAAMLEKLYAEHVKLSE